MAKKGWVRAITPRKENYKPFSLGDTANLTNEEWLKWREHGSHYNANDESDPYYVKRGYGGSTISAIFNLSPYTCAKELYDVKTGVVPRFKINFNEESKELGHIYEPAIADAFVYWWKVNYPSVPVKVYNDTRMFRHGKLNSDGTFKYPWALANLDRLVQIDGNFGVLEIKRTSDRNFDVIQEWQAGKVPIYYELQVRYYLAIMNLQFAYIVCSWGHRLDQMAVIRIDRDYIIEEEMFAGIAEFDELIENGIEPDYDECPSTLLANYYLRLYGVPASSTRIELSEKYRNTVLAGMRLEAKITELKNEVEKMEARRAEIYNDLTLLYNQAGTSYGTFQLDDDTIIEVKMKASTKRASYNTEQLKADHPDIYDAYRTDAFGGTAFKKEEPLLAKQYLNPVQLTEKSDATHKFEFKAKPVKTYTGKGAKKFVS